MHSAAQTHVSSVGRNAQRWGRGPRGDREV